MNNEAQIEALAEASLRPVVNATGIALHTNLGRAPLGPEVMSAVREACAGYSNLEFNLATASRGRRDDHVRSLLTFLTGADDAVVVNNNAAGIYLALHTLARDREVLISRGELIEIGGTFRIPEIVESSGARLVEVGTTNCTRVSDYEDAVNDNTAMIIKAHKSNYELQGSTEEVAAADLARLARSRGLVMLYDIGSGLLRKPEGLPLEDEPDVCTALEEGVDLVAFSCDKLLGGPQAGVVAGRREIVARLSASPVMRALRIGKLTYAALSAACRGYLRKEDLVKQNQLFAMLERSKADLTEMAESLAAPLEEAGVDAVVVQSKAQAGGGTLPNLRIDSFAVQIRGVQRNAGSRKTFEEALFEKLLSLDKPILAVLREGNLILDVFAMTEADITYAASAIIAAVRG